MQSTAICSTRVDQETTYTSLYVLYTMNLSIIHHTPLYVLHTMNLPVRRSEATATEVASPYHKSFRRPCLSTLRNHWPRRFTSPPAARTGRTITTSDPVATGAVPDTGHRLHTRATSARCSQTGRRPSGTTGRINEHMTAADRSRRPSLCDIGTLAVTPHTESPRRARSVNGPGSPHLSGPAAGVAPIAPRLAAIQGAAPGPALICTVEVICWVNRHQETPGRLALGNEHAPAEFDSALRVPCGPLALRE